MHPAVFKEFERICRERRIGGRVLEIGAVPSTDSLLTMNCLAQATKKIGLNLAGPSSFADFSIMQGNSNEMDCFEDEAFDAVICNSVLEHDKYFWKSLQEIRRVAAAGGIIIIGAPGYTSHGDLEYVSWLGRVPLVGRFFASLAASTRTLRVHNFPGDYYRFSKQTFLEVFLEGLVEVEVCALLSPPRIIGVGMKP